MLSSVARPCFRRTSLASNAFARRALSTRVVATVVGPERVNILTDVSKVISESDGKIHNTRAQSLGGTFSMMAEVEVATDSAALGFALQSKLPGFVTTLRPETAEDAQAAVFGRLDLKKYRSHLVLNRVTESITSHAISIATLRTSEHPEDDYLSATATLASSGEVDYNWLEGEIAELADKLNIDLEFKKLNPKTN